MLRTAYRLLATFEPCIPTKADKPPSGPGWVHETKHDGYRLIARRDGAGIRLLTRNGHDFSERYPAVVAAVNRLRCRSCVIDGEVAICNEHGLAIFERLQIGPRVKHDAVLLAFDLIELNGQDLKREPLLTRKATLLSLLKAAPCGRSICRAHRRPWRDDLPPRLQSRLRRHRVEACGLAIQDGPVAGLDQVQKPSRH
jgi:ATP-dependent DNA ligase